MIYKQPSIYKQGQEQNNDILYEYPINYFDDWIDISNEFTLINSFTCQQTLKILYSEKSKLIYFKDCGNFKRNSPITEMGWVPYLRYTGSKFNDCYFFDGFPPLNRGIILLPSIDNNYSTTNNGVRANYLNGPSNDHEFVFKTFGSHTYYGIQNFSTYWNVF